MLLAELIGFFPIRPKKDVRELASAYGISDFEMSDFCESIFEFADLGDAIDRNVKYSTGMRGLDLDLLQG